MRKLRLALNKGEELRFLSHLDYAQAVMRVLRRAGIDVEYSEGFNPHMKISFSSALGLGITASEEYMDMDLRDERSAEEIMALMNATAPKGLEVLRSAEKPDKVRKLMAICNYAVYEVRGSVTEAGADWDALLAPFNSAEEVEYEKVTPKKRRMINVKQFVKEPITVTEENGQVCLTMAVGIYPEGTMKPGEMWALGCERYGWPLARDYSIHRKAILVEESSGERLDPLTVI